LAKSIDVVRSGLRDYANRGVFRGLDEKKSQNGSYAFTFWWLGGHPLEFSLDTAKSALIFKQILPNVPSKSPLYSELRRFLETRTDVDLPDHRRIDPRRAEVLCVNRSGKVSIGLKVKKNQYAYALNRLLNLVHELFVQLNDLHPDYMCENFDVPQE
jgi:hypothetical protein